MNDLTIKQKAQVLADFLPLDVLEQQLAEVEESGAYEETHPVMQVFMHAVLISSRENDDEEYRENRRQGRELPADWEAENE